MNKEHERRRSFLRHILGGTAAVVGTAVLVKPAKAKKTVVFDSGKETLYRESEEFKQYYKTLR